MSHYFRDNPLRHEKRSSGSYKSSARSSRTHSRGAPVAPYTGPPYAGGQQVPYGGGQQMPYGDGQQMSYGDGKQMSYGAQQPPYGGGQPAPYNSGPPANYGGGPPTSMPRTKARSTSRGSRRRDDKLHGLKNHFVAATGEFVGTIMFLWFAFAWHQTVSTQTSIVADNGLPTAQAVLFIGLGYGFSLLVSVWAFYRISGGLFNPAVVLCLVLTCQLPLMRSLFLFPAELLGAIVAAALVGCMFPGDVTVVNTNLSSNTSVVRGVFIEMFLTCLLLFVILMLAAEKSKTTFLAPLGIGLALFVAELAGVLYTGGSLNPARSFGPAVATTSFPSYHWIYWVGPCLGSLVTAGYFHFVKWLNYEEANPGQDSAAGDFVPGGNV